MKVPVFQKCRLHQWTRRGEVEDYAKDVLPNEPVEPQVGVSGMSSSIVRRAIDSSRARYALLQ